MTIKVREELIRAEDEAHPNTVKIFTMEGENGLLLRISKEIYSSEAVMATAQKFTGKCAFFIVPATDSTIDVRFESKQESTLSEVRSIALAFCNELIEQQVRVNLEAKFGSIRDLIVQQAFSPISNAKSACGS